MQTFMPALAEREKLMNFLLMLILHHLFSPTPTRRSKQEESREIRRWLFSAMEFHDSISSDSRDDCETGEQEHFLITSLSSARWRWLRCRCTWYWIKSISDREMHFPSDDGWSETAPCFMQIGEMAVIVQWDTGTRQHHHQSSFLNH